MPELILEQYPLWMCFCIVLLCSIFCFVLGILFRIILDFVSKLILKIFKDTRLKPKEVVFYRNELGSLDCYCPCCGFSLSDFVQDNYCRECGQAVKWPQIVEEYEHP